MKEQEGLMSEVESTGGMSANELADMVIDLIEEWPADSATIAAAKQMVLERLVTDSN